MKLQNADGVKLQTRRKRRYNPRKGLSVKQQKAVRAIVDKKFETKPEKKRFDYVDASETISPFGSGYVQDITEISQGTSVDSRVGAQIKLSHIGIRFLLHAKAAQSLDAFMARVLVVQWRPDTASEPLGLVDLLASTNYIAGFFQAQDAGQFKVLYDERFQMSGSTDTGDYSRVMDISIKGDTKGLQPVRYNTGANTGENHIYLIVLNDDNNVSVAYPVMRNLFSRIRYTDM